MIKSHLLPQIQHEMPTMKDSDGRDVKLKTPFFCFDENEAKASWLNLILQALFWTLDQSSSL